jgi:hypothetical protein
LDSAINVPKCGGHTPEPHTLYSLLPVGLWILPPSRLPGRSTCGGSHTPTSDRRGSTQGRRRGAMTRSAPNHGDPPVLEFALPFLGPRDILGSASVCSAWRSMVGNPTLWRSVVCSELGLSPSLSTASGGLSLRLSGFRSAPRPVKVCVGWLMCVCFKSTGTGAFAWSFAALCRDGASSLVVCASVCFTASVSQCLNCVCACV